MNSEILAVILCLMGIVSIIIFPKYTYWRYQQQFKGNNNAGSTDEYIATKLKKYALPLKITIWSYRIGGIAFFIMAAYIYFTDFLG